MPVFARFLPEMLKETPFVLVDKRRFFWRRGWDSNPCALARKLISSQPRYDHFDTSPGVFPPSKPSKITLENEEKRRRENGY